MALHSLVGPRRGQQIQDTRLARWLARQSRPNDWSQAILTLIACHVTHRMAYRWTTDCDLSGCVISGVDSCRILIDASDSGYARN